MTYGHLSRLLDDAHRQIGLPIPESRHAETGELYDSEAMGGRMPCMIGQGDARSIDIWLADGSPIEFDKQEQQINFADAVEASARYGIDPNEIFGTSGEMRGILSSLFETARKMLLKDGYHCTMMFFFKGARVVKLLELRPEKHGQKYLLMRDLAHDTLRKGADAAILIGEVWFAPYNASDPYRRASDSPERSEALVATLVAKSGEPKQLSAIMTHGAGGLELSETQEQVDGAHFIFAPFYEAWGREIPQEWAGHLAAFQSEDAAHGHE